MLKGKKILLGVSGGIAVYKAVALTSKLTQAGAEVKVIMTDHAAEFVTPLTFQAISRNPVYTDTFDEKDPAKIAHIDLADWADLVVLAPATANLLGKLANGIADDMLTTTLLATEADIYVAPAMNVHMYQHPAVIQNMTALAAWGYRFIEPGDGYLACGYVGKGRLEEPEQIVRVLEKDNNRSNKWAGKKVLVTAGPTREPIDPVRYFTNYSSGKMGYALAQKAAEQGAEVYLVSGPTHLTVPPLVEHIPVTTAQEMFAEVTERFAEMDLVIKTAAVADYRPKAVLDQKMKKQKQEWSVEMERNVDILQYLGEHKQQQFLVGFAAETQDIKNYGKDKLERKHLDAIVLNDVSRRDIGFDSDQNEVIFMTKDGTEQAIKQASKLEIAEQVIGLIDDQIRKG
ncbi:bifunctional phosphopantothenoylcysteine decarboxylase/phosphopantothenate--cysteine ligase CoaBC [Gracilibacillus alcaliphilus]|uniref:bifunctional phosphopantothenoylcysteine decarboxylase/phosphopantothenate--cysteine ligase CoaBC n=1 Tax=Gracilibacillus alcaliphilus TaxID=1401441 RepID=UPI0019598702|nr:bifunctional phosphopantothenoylcysteine decarboxylase/phosphopantothenate--cysteine ligase CoaBC [Gracilibacillus alcaliphilus]MBM7678343.1 phosphopantothenoylcysteine decarboxylase/phosphopantothenate--cysteine ligase [Gracilibacillus alcaliphilus]